MHFTSAFLAVVCGTAAAFPFPFQQPKEFSISVARHGENVDNLRRSLHSRAATAGTTGSGKVQLNTYWYANASAGGQPLVLTVDTGSAVTWALSPNTSAQQNSGQLIYDPTKSKGASRIAGETFSIFYGDGSVGTNGTGWTDQICVGTACVSSNIGVAQYITGFTPGTFKSGLLGLAFGATSQWVPNKLPTFMENLQKTLTLPVFVANFRSDNTGTLDFGFVNSSLYTGALQSVKVNNSTGFWQADNVAYYANNKQLGGNLSMIFDSGSPVIQVSNDTINAYFAQMPSAKYVNGRWQYACSNWTQLPEFQLRFPSGAVGKIPGTQMHWGYIDSSNCVTYLQATTGPGTMGNPWFNTMITVFNQTAPSLSFAPKSS